MNKNKLDSLFGFLVYAFIVSAIILSTFYIHPSGMAQPGHIAILVSVALLLLIKRKEATDFFLQNRYIPIFFGLVFLINVGYWLYMSNLVFLINTSYWLYSLLVLGAAALFSGDERYYSFVKWLIFLKFVFIAGCYLVGVGGYTWWPRYEYFFNGPNQLAYFVICMAVVFFVVNKARPNLMFFMVYALAVFIVISTGARSAYVGMAPLVLIFMYVFRKNWLHLLVLLAIPFVVNLSFSKLCLPFYVAPDVKYVQNSCGHNVSNNTINRINNLSMDREEKSANSVWEQFAARGYTRLYKYPEYILFGSGQGGDERFGEVSGYVYEIHSSITAILFYYGVLGFFLFFKFIYDLFRVKSNLIFLIPAFAYGLFTYGLRAPYFWIMLAFVAVMPNVFEKRSTQAVE